MPSPPPDPRAPASREPETVTSFGERTGRIDLALSVVAESYIGVYPLPVSGQVTIGRDPEAALSIDHPSLSRRHAMIGVESASALTLEDLGSKNGTRVGERLLAPGERCTLAIGDTVLLGGVRLIVLTWGARGVSPSLLGSTAFLSRLEYECARARRTRRPFAVVRLRVEGGPGESELGALVGSLSSTERASTALGAAEFASIVAAGEGAEEAAALVTRVRAALESRGGSVRAGIAVYPGDGQSSEALLLSAAQLLDGQAAKVAMTAGAGRAIVVDASMLRLHTLARRVAATNVSVLLLGETGCGKEIVAETIHAASSRKDQPFVRLNCAAFSEGLLESELFGHERGAYSGAVQAKAGLLETAHGGTLLLDEIGELPLELQAKLLRFLEGGEIRRVGGLRSKQVDVRIIAATNRDLERESQTGAFRADLYHRLNGFTLTIPPLRERPAEILALAQHFLEDAAKEQRRPAPRLSPDALERLTEHPWPGNVRELRNVVRAALIICGDGAEITPDHLPVARPARREDLVPARASAAPLAPPPSSRSLGPGRATEGPPPGRAPYRDPDEPRRIADALARCGGNQAHAAAALGISRTTLLKRMLAFGLRPAHLEGPFADPEERRRVVEALEACGGNRSKAAARLGLSRSALVMRMLAFGLNEPEDVER